MPKTYTEIFNLEKDDDNTNYDVMVQSRNMDKTEAALVALKEGQTATEILEKLLTVDGEGSGLNADKLDGKNSTEFALVDEVTPEQILEKLLIVDENDAGINATTLQGIELSKVIYGANESGTSEYTGDVNLIAKSGFYYINNGSTNVPFSVGHLIHVQRPATPNNASQYFISATSNNSWMRIKNSGAWGEWEKVWNSGNDGHLSGLNADTLDDMHLLDIGSVNLISSYGSTTDPNVPVAPYILTNHANAPVSGTYFYINTIAYGDMYAVSGDGIPNQALQIAFPYNTYSVGAYYRLRINGAWSAWVKVWSQSNQLLQGTVIIDTSSWVASGNSSLPVRKSITLGGTLPADHIELRFGGSDYILADEAGIGLTESASGAFFVYAEKPPILDVAAQYYVVRGV